MSGMKARTVRDLIDVLERVEDKGRTVMVAGGGPWEGVVTVGLRDKGQLVLWCAEEHERKRPDSSLFAYFKADYDDRHH